MFILFKLVLIFIFLTGCKSSQLAKNFKENFAPENKAIIFNKSSTTSKINIPINGIILVKKNDTIYSIANKYNVIPKNIIKDNNLINPYTLKENQSLYLRNKNFYVVRMGDSLEKISLRFAVNKLDIIKLNQFKNRTVLEIGSKILIPVKRSYSIIDQIIDQKIYNTKPSIKKYKNNKVKKIKNAPNFIWPAKGKIIKNYGSFGKGLHNDGLDMKLKNNTPILSSYDGKVAFVGSQIKKFGNLILIRHNNGWLTAYSNFGRYNVKQGQSVKKKQVIAYSSLNEEIFHFQIRHRRNPVNPNSYIN
ncbi:M23 family metallopeptidase [Alphaproteobacteria bacterium]|nr:M23 family metallopeptidase [Alphaproteobacteria bacterium]